MGLKAKIKAFKEQIKSNIKQAIDFKETKAGKQLLYNETININIFMYIAIFTAGFLTMLLIIPQSLITTLFNNPLLLSRFLSVLAIVEICLYVYFAMWIISLFKFQRGLTKWTKQKG